MVYKYKVPFWFIKEEGNISDLTLITQVLLYAQPEDLIALVNDYGLAKCYKIFKENVSSQKNIKGWTVNLLEVMFDALFKCQREYEKYN